MSSSCEFSKEGRIEIILTGASQTGMHGAGHEGSASASQFHSIGDIGEVSCAEPNEY